MLLIFTKRSKNILFQNGIFFIFSIKMSKTKFRLVISTLEITIPPILALFCEIEFFQIGNHCGVLELDWIMDLPKLKNSTSSTYFSKPEPKKTRSQNIAKTQNQKNSIIITRSNPFLNCRKFCQFWSKFSLTLVNSKTQRVLSQFS